MNSLVSIITPCFNSSKFIEKTIGSVLNQSYKNWEMIIVDDNSLDNSKEIIKKIALIDSRIKIIFLSQNIGAAEARNVALRASNGRFIAFLDSDDLWNHKKLEYQLNFMQTNDIAFSFTSYQLLNESGSKKNNIILAPRKINYHEYLKNTIIGCLTVIIDKKKIGYFEMPNIRSSHDMALWLWIMKQGYCAYGIPKVLASYRIVSNSNTSSKIKAAKDVWNVYRNIENIGFIKSIWYFINYVINAIIKRI